MDELVRFHEDWAYVAITLNFIAGFLMLAGLKWTSLRRKKYFFPSVYVGWGAMIVQVFLGISLYMSDHRVPTNKGFHYFYGFLVLIITAFLYAYRKQWGSKKILIMGCSSLFLAAMSLRAALLVLIK